MKVTRFSMLGSALLFAIVGCGPKAEAPDKEGTSQTQVEKPGLKVQGALISEGLKYVGYPFDKKITYEANGLTTTGEKLTEILIPSYESRTDGTGLLTFSYDGEPTDLPSETYAVEKTGIYGVSLGGTEVKPRVMALPAVVEIGKTWSGKTTYQQPQTVIIDTTFKIVGREKVKVLAGEYDALLVSETGTLKIGDNPSTKVSGKSWFVSGIGAVKRTMTQTDSAGKTSNITIEAVTIQ